MRVQINNYTAWITVNGEEKPQHSIEYSADGTVATCWISSEAGKKFSVYWQDSLRQFPSSGCVSVDGMRSNGKLLNNSRFLYADGIASRDGMRTSATTKRPFMFSELELTDDDQYLYNATSPELGEIKLVIHRCKLAGKTPNVYTKFSEPEKIHEKSKKAMGHRCRLGTETTCRPSTHGTRSKRVEKLATFVFKYRPLAQLQANGIVPREQRKREASNEIIDLTLDEPSLLERKPEIRTRKRVKEEPVTFRVKKEDVSGRRQLRQPGEVIDLT